MKDLVAFKRQVSSHRSCEELALSCSRRPARGPPFLEPEGGLSEGGLYYITLVFYF